MNRPHVKTYTKNGTAEGTPAVTYGYDADTRGALSSVSVQTGGATYSTTYIHDSLGRIAASTQTTAGQTAFVFGYQHSLSDRLQRMQYPSGRVVNYVADSAGRVGAVQNGLSLANYAALRYTAPGGISTMALANGTTERTMWNDRLQMTGLQAGQGQRVQKVSGGVTTTYVYDADGNLAAEYSTNPVSSACGTATCYVTVDQVGSTRLLTDSNGNVARRYDYLPFGTELLAGTGGRTGGMEYQAAADSFSLRYAGQVRDAETGLDYMRARMYSAAQGRFTGVDPGNAGSDLGDPQSWNGYAYVGNNPLLYTDASREGIFGFIGGIIGGLIGGPWGALAGSAAGNGIDTAIWGRGAAGIPGTSFNFGSLTSCGEPLGNCVSIGGIWTEGSGPNAFRKCFRRSIALD